MAFFFTGIDLCATQESVTQKVMTAETLESAPKKRKAPNLQLKAVQRRVQHPPIRVEKGRVMPDMTRKEWKHKNKPNNRGTFQNKTVQSPQQTIHSPLVSTSLSMEAGREKPIFVPKVAVPLEKTGNSGKKIVEQSMNDVKMLFSGKPSTLNDSLNKTISFDTLSQKTEKDSHNYLGRDPIHTAISSSNTITL